MSVLRYQFASASGTSWTHRIICDFCKKFVEREGEMPNAEGVKTPRFPARALVGWGKFSLRASHPPFDKDGNPIDVPEDAWPHLDRDLCPGCAQIGHDFFCQLGCEIGHVEERYLDVCGRPAGGENALIGTRACLKGHAQPGAAAGAAQSLCFRATDHAGDHTEVLDPDTFLCVVCVMLFSQQQQPYPRVYSQRQLEQHAVDAHSVRFSDGELTPRGWYTERETSRVAYGDVQTALTAERKCIEGEAYTNRSRRLAAEYLLPGQLQPWIHGCPSGLGGFTSRELPGLAMQCPACGMRRPW